MERSKVLKLAGGALVTFGMSVLLPPLAPYVSLAVSPWLKDVIISVFPEGVPVKMKENLGDALGGIAGNIASSAIWELPGTLSKSPENQDLLRLLANAYLQSLNEFEISEDIKESDKEKMREQADRIFPPVKRWLKNSIDKRSAEALLRLFPVDKDSKKGDLNYSFANRITSENIILQMAEESFSEDVLIADEAEISIRRWYNEGRNDETQNQTGYTLLGLSVVNLPEELCAELRKQLPKTIPQKIGELIKTEGFEKSWTAFQRSHLQAILKEVKNQNNGLSKEDRELLEPLAKRLDRLANLDGVPETLAALSQDLLTHFSNFDEVLKTNQTALLDAISEGEKRLIKKIGKLKKKIQSLKEDVRDNNKLIGENNQSIGENNKSIGELRSEIGDLTASISELSKFRDNKNSEENNALEDMARSIEALAKKISEMERPLIFNFSQTGDSTPRFQQIVNPDEQLDEAKSYLLKRDYQTAFECLEKIDYSISTEQNGRKQTFRALALLGERSFNSLPNKDLVEIENLLLPAHRNSENSNLPLVLLAILELDYYLHHGQKGKSGITPSILRKKLEERKLSEDEIKLLTAIKIGERAKGFIGL